jgi:hypothetical protein
MRPVLCVSLAIVLISLACQSAHPTSAAQQASTKQAVGRGVKPVLSIFHQPYVFTDFTAIGNARGFRVADTSLTATGSWIARAGGVRLAIADNASIVNCNRPNQAGGAAGGVCEIFYASAEGNPPSLGTIWQDAFEIERWERDEIATKSSSETYLKILAGEPCLQFRIRIDREAREVTAIGSPISAGCSGATVRTPVLRLYQRAD